MKTEKDRLSDEAIANKRRYDNEYLMNNYKNFSVHIPKEEYEDFNKLLKIHKMTKVQFVRLAFKLLKEDKIKKED